MTTLPPPFTKEFPVDSLEKKAYGIVDKFVQYLPVENDRNRLGFALFKYFSGEGDPPLQTVKYAKLTLEGITERELAQKIDKEIKSIGLAINK
ncbi:MAG TPA: hypothetical protein PK397_02650 [Ignavibacteriaceae bacterium]|jgi:hypothetical protein|nr:hypothetical protein [Ignavibacteriaceae bacterium]